MKKRANVTPLHISKCRNMHGPLNDDCRARLLAVINTPSQKTWDDNHGLVIGADGWMTLWQAVTAVDPTFPRVGRTERRDTSGKVISRDPWPRIPTTELLLRAVEHAANLPAKKAAR